MTVTKVIALLFVLVSIALAQECKVSISQHARTTWTSDEGSFTLYDVGVLNDGDAAIFDVSLKTTSAFESYWEVQEEGGEFTFPDWRNQVTLYPGAVHEFGYIVKSASPAEFEVVSCELDTPAPTITPDTEGEDDLSSVEVSAEGEKVTRGRKKATTTRAPRPTTTRAPRPTSSTSTRAPSGTTKAPSTPTTTKAPTTPTTTKAPTTSTTTKSPSGGGSCGSGSWWKPAPGTTWQWQLTGTIDQSVDVQMYDIDLFDASASLISSLHSKGRVVVCYFSTQYEDWRPDAKSFTSSVIGSALDGWAGEAWVDIRSTTVRNIMKARMALAQSKGCDGIEPDNVDGYSNGNGLGLTAADQLDFNKYLASTAHSYGLSIGLKNDLAQAKALQPYFDWALNEQCYQYSECTSLDVFVSAGKAVFNTEYSGKAATVCPYMVGRKFSSLIKKLSLDASITAQCCTYASGGCAKVAATCGNSARSALLEGEEPQFNDVEVYEMDSSAHALSQSTFAIFAVATLALALLF